MKTRKLILSGAIAFSTLLTPAAAMQTWLPVMAEGETVESPYSITIKQSKPGYYYEAYQIFAGTIETTADGDTVLKDIVWGSGVNQSLLSANLSNEFKKDGVVLSAAEIAEKLNDSNAEAFSVMIAKCLNSTKAGEGTVPAGTAENPGSTVTINVNQPGYYLVKDGSTNNDVATKFILEVAGKAEADIKGSSVPNHEKKVDENVKVDPENSNPDLNEQHRANGKNYTNDVADYTIGDKIPFHLAATVPANISEFKNYTFRFNDTMTKGLDFLEEGFDVYYKQSATDTRHDLHPITDDNPNGDYTLNVNSDKHGFNVEIKIKEENKETLRVPEGATIYIDFYGKLNANAELNTDGNVNTFQLEYSNNPQSDGFGKTKEDKVIVFTYTRTVNKTNKAGQALEGAEFVLSRTVDGVEEFLTATLDEAKGEYTVNGWVRKAAGSDDIPDSATTLKGQGTSKNKFVINGLDDGDYKLYETKVPTGYNTPSGPFDLKVKVTTVNGQGFTGDNKDDLITLPADDSEFALDSNVENTKGSELPSTGGMGTTLFYTVGGVLVAGAAVLMVTNKRAKRED